MSLDLMSDNTEDMDLVVVGFAQYKHKIEYVNKWCKKATDISNNRIVPTILEEVPGKSQMKLIYKNLMCKLSKEVVIEYDKADEAVALQQIAALLGGPGLIGLDDYDIFSLFSSKIKCLTYAIHGNNKEDYLLAAREYLTQIAPNYNFNHDSIILSNGDVDLILLSELVNFYAEKIAGKDNQVRFQGFYDERLTPNTIQVTIWLNETDN